MEQKIKIGSSQISIKSKPWIIAEISGNHNQSLDRALKIVDAAAEAGANAIKLQTYTPDTMTLNMDTEDFRITDEKSPWFGRTLYDLYEEAHTPWEWHEPIFEYASQRGLDFFSTPFDNTAVDFLERLDVPAYKIASFENIDLPLIARVAQTGKPIIISTGMASKEEIAEAISTAKSEGCVELIILHCVSGYPTPVSESNIRMLQVLADEFGVPVGLSDHTSSTITSVVALSLGAVVIEKHLTLSRKDGGPDAAFSLEPHEFKRLVEDCNVAHSALAAPLYDKANCEESSEVFRRSIYVVENVRAGDSLSSQNLRCIRPGYGMKPKHLSKIMGRKFVTDVERGTPLDTTLFE